MLWIPKENDFSTEIVKNKSEYIDIFSSEWKKEIIINNDVDFNYLVISDSPDIFISINTNWDKTTSKIFWIFYSSSSPTKAKVEFNLNNDNSKTEIYLLSITKENQHISVDWSINMARWVKKASGILLEDNLVFWDNVSIKTKPILNIYSNDVQASHWARIEKVDAEKMFYLSSKWISLSVAEKLILDWYIDYVLNHFVSIDQTFLKSKITQT